MPFRILAPGIVRLLVTWTFGAHANPCVWKGISYGVSPDQGEVESDDFFNDPARAQWGCPGRGDLRLMTELGANTVRLYGNDPRWDHKAFLDEAGSLGLGVIPGISDYPYIQGQENCAFWGGGLESKAFIEGTSAQGNCHDNIKESYLENLKKGFVVNGKYHPGLQTMIVVNEPDLKLGAHPRNWAKSVISAIDGMLSAEDEVGLTCCHLPFTVTVSFSICGNCEAFSDKPGLGQMWTLRDAMRNPAKYGYKPKHDLAEFYEARFINSFNTGNPATEIEDMFLHAYSSDPRGFKGKPVFIAEYHCPSEPVLSDLKTVLKLASRSKELLGVSFFEWMNRHDDGGHTDWGIFDLGGSVITKMNYNGTLYDIKSLHAVKDSVGTAIPKSLGHAYGGRYSKRSACYELHGQSDIHLR